MKKVKEHSDGCRTGEPQSTNRILLEENPAGKGLEDSLRMRSFVLDRMPGAVYLIDEGGFFRYVNEEACRILGYSRGELLERTIVDVDPDWPVEGWPERWRELTIHGSLAYDGRYLTKDGDVFPVEIKAKYLEYQGQGYYVTLVRDITENMRGEGVIRKLNREQEQANSKLKEIDRLKSMFVASMSHELRTPLNSIIGFSRILLNEWTGPLNAEQKENLSAVLRSGKQLLSLINDVMDVSKIESGK